MSRTRLSPIDIVGISLGVLVILIVLGSVVAIARGHLFDLRFSVLEGRGFFGDMSFPIGGAVREEADEQVPAGSYNAVEIRNIAGSIDISGSTAVNAVAVHSLKSAPSQAAMDGMHVDIQKQGDRLVIEEKHDRGFLRNLGTVSFRMTVPAGVKVIEAHSVSGSIDVTGVSPGVDQVLSTVSGSVSTERARNLDVYSTSGHISFSSSGSTLSARSVSGSIDGTIDSLPAGGTARVSTVSGSVSLTAFAALDAALALHSVSGSVSCDFPVTISEQKRNRLNGKIGSGSATVDIGTVSGSISIAKE
jgi:DUF4097 and DUF4098 domain-containing protein YvlB